MITIIHPTQATKCCNCLNVLETHFEEGALTNSPMVLLAEMSLPSWIPMKKLRVLEASGLEMETLRQIKSQVLHSCGSWRFIHPCRIFQSS
uniref:Uncharacterized protein n=1 Tax=Picea sitchensis TaxID=3332 RepID=B8LQL9_PICSI|nr:unknown [Picea sitchensis]